MNGLRPPDLWNSFSTRGFQLQTSSFILLRRRWRQISRHWLLSGTLFVVVRMRIPCLPHHTLNCCSHVQASGVQVQTPNSSPSRSRSDVPRWIGTQVNVNTSLDLLSLSSNREDVSIAVEFDGYDSTSSHRPSTIDNKVDVTIAAHALNIHNLDLEKIGKWTERRSDSLGPSYPPPVSQPSAFLSDTNHTGPTSTSSTSTSSTSSTSTLASALGPSSHRAISTPDSKGEHIDAAGFNIQQ